MPQFTIPSDFTDRQRIQKVLDRLITEKLSEISTFAENVKQHRSFHLRTRLAYAPSNIRRPARPKGRLVLHLRHRLSVLLYREGKRVYCFMKKKKIKIDQSWKPNGYVLFEMIGQSCLSSRHPEMSASEISQELGSTWQKYSSRRKRVYDQKAMAWKKDLDNYLLEEDRRYMQEVNSIIQDAERAKIHTLRKQLHYLKTRRAEILGKD